MYNQTELVLSQYEIKVHGIIKGRGAFICDTSKGMKLLVPFRGSQEKGRILREFLLGLQGIGFEVEQIELNQNAEAVTEDEASGERFILKSYIEGTEVSTSKLEDMREAVKVLAIYHNAAEKIVLGAAEQQVKEEVVESYKRHYRELIKARNFIRSRKKKSEFEQIYMKNYEHNRTSAEQSIAILEELDHSQQRCVFCHGDFNQHNVLLTEGKYQILHFENFSYNWAMTDLANFVRKMLEKNEWNERVGMDLIRTYDKYRPIGKEEYIQLHGLLLFPEKFWKVTNHYMNSRKTWISGRDIDKLKKVIEQEEKRLKFMENLFSFLE